MARRRPRACGPRTASPRAPRRFPAGSQGRSRGASRLQRPSRRWRRSAARVPARARARQRAKRATRSPLRSRGAVRLRCEARAREPRREVGTLAQDEKRAASDQHFEREPRRESHGRRPETRHRWNIVWQAGDQRRGVAAPGCIVGCRLVVVAHRSASVSPSRSARRPIATVDPYPHRAGRDAGARSRVFDGQPFELHHISSASRCASGSRRDAIETARAPDPHRRPQVQRAHHRHRDRLARRVVRPEAHAAHPGQDRGVQSGALRHESEANRWLARARAAARRRRRDPPGEHDGRWEEAPRSAERPVSSRGSARSFASVQIEPISLIRHSADPR